MSLIRMSGVAITEKTGKETATAAAHMVRGITAAATEKENGAVRTVDPESLQDSWKSLEGIRSNYDI